MARPRSERKRSFLLEAAAMVVAERGDGAPTALIAKVAGVAEGSLFTYFKNKGELLTELYGALAAQAFSAVPAAPEARADGRERLLIVWTSIIQWGLANPEKWTALRVLGLSNLVDERRKGESRLKGRQFLLEQLGVHDDLPGFYTSLLSAFINVTIDLVRQKPRLAKQYCGAGFEALCRALDIQ